MNSKIVFIGAKRTPFGSFGGSLAKFTATDLAVFAAKACISQSGIDIALIDHCIFGNVMQTSSDAAYLARHVALQSGLTIETPAVTVNRLCGSGFEAIADAARRIKLGQSNLVLAGGTESMSSAPFVLRGARFGYKMNHQPLEDSLMAGLYDSFAKMSMSETAELLAEKHQITRAQCDEYAALSQTRASHALNHHFFDDEIAKIQWEERGAPRELGRDEHIRPDCTIEGLSRLKTVFKKDGVITAGNASGMVDGASALLMTTQANAERLGAPILGYFVDSVVLGCDPKVMGIGPVVVTRQLLERNHLSLSAICRFEINEAFAAQYLAVEKTLGLPREKTNVEGGAIAIGHPLGASGSRLITHLLCQIKKLGGGYGIGSACIGGGQGIAVLIKV